MSHTVYASRHPCYICGRHNATDLTVSNWNGSKFTSCGDCCARFPLALGTPSAPELPPEPTTDPSVRILPDFIGWHRPDGGEWQPI